MDVLVLDGQALVQMMLSDALEHDGLACQCAASVEEAEAVVSALGPPRVLVTERVILNADGREEDIDVVIAKLTAEAPGLGVIYSTGYGRPKRALHSHERLLRKPYDPEMLLALVRQFIPKRALTA